MRRTYVTLLVLLIPTVGLRDRVNRDHTSGLDCTIFNGYGVQRCTAYIDSRILDARALERQRASEWCWAASIQAVFDYYGHDISQERIVREVWGRIDNVPASPNQILVALNREWVDDDGIQFAVRSDVYGANHATAAQDLAADFPLIIGTVGHAMVLTALTYDRDIYGRGQIVSAVVRDPWPYQPRRRILTPQEWYSTTMLARIRVIDRD